MSRQGPRIAAWVAAALVVAAVAAYARYATLRAERLSECMDLAVHRMHMGDMAGCEQAFKDALAIDERYLPARNGLADTYDDRGDSEGALAEHRRGTEVDRRNPEAHLALARALIEYHRFRAAVAPLKEASRLAPRDVHTRLLLASMYRRIGDTQAAKRELDEIERIEPGSSRTWNARLAMARDAQRALKPATAKTPHEAPRETTSEQAPKARRRSASERAPGR
jgi:Tfp pilus assembly protein PilF